MSLPAKGGYPSFAALEAVAQDHARSAGYAFVISKSTRERGRFKKILMCNRGGKYRTLINKKCRKRERLTQKTDYKFLVVVKERPNRT